VQQRLEGLDSAANDRGALLQRSREELEATRHRQLEQQQDTLRRLLSKSEQWLAFEHDPFRQALNVSLELLGVSGLEPYTDERGQACWRLANPEQLVSQTRDSSWDTTLDSLRGVKPAKAFLSDWRSDNPVRPVIFSDPGRLSAEAVHLHLEHRLVQRLLSRFLAQGFLHHELKRACVVPCRDPQPRLIVLGRLSLFGEGAARLHDELISVMADWHPGDDRQQALRPVGGDQRQIIWSLLQEALKEAAGGNFPALDTSHLQRGADADVSALLPQLQQEAERAKEAATGLLQERGRLEAEALKTVLRNQRQRIRDTVRQRSQEIARLDRKAAKTAQTNPTPLITGLADAVKIPELDPASMSERERRQLASDQKHWQRRLETIDTELASEPKRIEASYRVVTHRLEPAGLVYLWPISG
ncbi:MAG: helicase, partial [Cyanobium sp.]